MALRNRSEWVRRRAEAIAAGGGDDERRLVTTDGHQRTFQNEHAMRAWMARHAAVDAYPVDNDSCTACGGHGERRNDNNGSPFAFEECPACRGVGVFHEPDLDEMDEEGRQEYLDWREKVGL